jgi:glycosyltransferase involved in cell wall biosynthesis
LSTSRPFGKGISVIVPTFFRAYEIDSLLFPSIQGQILAPREVLVVDDTPDVSVEETCEKWRPRFAASGIELAYLRNPLQRSRTKARKYGGSRASGDLLAFLDSDLILDMGYFDGILRVFGNDPQAAGVQGHIVNSLDDSRIRAFRRVIKNPQGTSYAMVSWLLRYFFALTIPSTNSCRLFEYPQTLESTIACDWVNSSNMTIRRELFNSIEPEGDSYGEDVLLSLQLKRFGRLYITPHAKCSHMSSPTGRMDTASYLRQEKHFLGKILGSRGTVVYYNRRFLFGFMKKMGLIQG